MTNEQFKELEPTQMYGLILVYMREMNSNSEYQESLSDFISRAQHTIGCDGAIVIKHAGMFLLVEKDGYTHS